MSTDTVTGPAETARWILPGAYLDAQSAAWANPDGSWYWYSPKLQGACRARTSYLVDQYGRAWEWGPQDTYWVPRRPVPKLAPRWVRAGLIWGALVMLIGAFQPSPGGAIVLGLLIMLFGAWMGHLADKHPAIGGAIVAIGVYSAVRAVGSQARTF